MDAILGAAETWADKHKDAIPPGFAPSQMPDGSVDYGTAGFVKTFLAMAPVMAEILGAASRQLKVKAARSAADARAEFVGVFLPLVIEEVFGRAGARVQSGSHANKANKRADEVMAESVNYRLINGSLRLVELWQPRDGAGKNWKPETLAADAKRAMTANGESRANFARKIPTRLS